MFHKSWRVLKLFWKQIFAVAIPLALLPLLILVDTQEAKCGFVILWMALYWMFEPIPLAVTALIPIVCFPLLGLLTTSETCAPYMKDTIMMYIGGLTLAAAVEHCNLHKRIALRVLLTIGTGAKWLMLGFMATTMFLSMWISNTATTAMMVPIVDAVLTELEKEDQIAKDCIKTENQAIPVYTALSSDPWKTDNTKHQYTINISRATSKEQSCSYKRLREALLLSIAYSANCGGTGTVIGSGPNLVLKGIMEETFPKSTDLTFATWLFYNTPGMIICVLICWVGLQLFYFPLCSQEDGRTQQAAKSAIMRSYKELGEITFHEIAVSALFILLVGLWFLRDPQFIEGWASWFSSGNNIKDATPAIAVCLLLFIIPAKPSLTKRSPPLLDWRTAQRKISWGVLLLLGSGFAVAEAAKKSHLSAWLGLQLSHLSFLSPTAIMIILTIVSSILTEVISNMSMATIMLPVISQMAQAIHVHPLYLMLPVTIGCSFAMMLPVGNPSNAIVFDASVMTTFDMIKPGFVLKIFCCAVELLMIETLGVALFDLNTFPAWAYDNSTYDNQYIELSVTGLFEDEMNSTSLFTVI